ncbi:hypothetical protein M758_5G171700 [Ceratodon purpureus]|nr:hypothetical protein M758_5G171700 [Ceratodon purpureus]
MFKERHRYRVAPNTPRAGRVPGRVPQRSNIVPLDNVGIVPGSRFILLPFKKASTIVHRHRCCRSSATSTKTCIVQKATMVSQPVLFQNAPLVDRVVSAGDVVLGRNGLKNNLRPGFVRRSNRLARRSSLKRRYPHPAVVKTCLSPVSEQDQEDINSRVREFFVDKGSSYWSQEIRQPVDSLEKFNGSLHSGIDQDLFSAVDIQSEPYKMVETERFLKDQVSQETERQPTSTSTSRLWRENGTHVGHEENSGRLDAYSFVSDTNNQHSFIEAPDLCSKLLAGSTLKTCDDDSVLSSTSPSLQHGIPSLQRHCGIPRAATTIENFPLVSIEAKKSSNRAKILSQPSNHASSVSFLGPSPASNSVNFTNNCNRAPEGSINTPRLLVSTTVEPHLGQQLEQVKEKNVERKGLELGALQRVLQNRVHQLPGDQLHHDPVHDQFVTKDQSFKTLVDELQRRIAKARFSAEKGSAMISSNHEHTGRAAASMQGETTLRGALQTVVVPHHLRRGNKKLRKVVPRIHTFGRNRVSPSSGSAGGQKAFQFKSIGQQFLLPPQTPENSINTSGVGEFGTHQGRSGGFRFWNEDFHGNNQSCAVSCVDIQMQKYLKGFSFSCTGSDDLPIGPLRI